MSISEQAFWNFYARLYDTLGTTIPYTQLHREIVGCLKHIHNDQARVLDAGCGTGHQLKLIRDRHPSWRLSGLDRSEAMLQVASRKLRDDNVVLQQGDLSKPLPFNDETFDAVISTNVLYTLPDPVAHLRELRRILKKGGTLVLVNPWNPKPHLVPIAHYQRIIQRKRPEEILSTIVHTPSYVTIFALNLLIAAKAKNQTYTFTPAHAFSATLESCGFKIHTARQDIYANTCVLFQAKAV